MKWIGCERGDQAGWARCLLPWPHIPKATVRFRTATRKRRLTDFGRVWYLIVSDFKQRAESLKRRSSILPVRPSPGTRHATRSARRVWPTSRLRRRHQPVRSGLMAAFFCFDRHDDESAPRQWNTLDAAIAGLGGRSSTEALPFSSPECMEYSGSVHSRMNVIFRLHSSLVVALRQARGVGVVPL